MIDYNALHTFASSVASDPVAMCAIGAAMTNIDTLVHVGIMGVLKVPPARRLILGDPQAAKAKLDVYVADIKGVIDAQAKAQALADDMSKAKKAPEMPAACPAIVSAEAAALQIPPAPPAA